MAIHMSTGYRALNDATTRRPFRFLGLHNSTTRRSVVSRAHRPVRGAPPGSWSVGASYTDWMTMVNDFSAAYQWFCCRSRETVRTHAPFRLFTIGTFGRALWPTHVLSLVLPHGFSTSHAIIRCHYSELPACCRKSSLLRPHLQLELASAGIATYQQLLTSLSHR